MEFTSIPIIVILCYIIGEIYKVLFKNNKDLYKLIPIILACVGGLLGVLIFLTNPEILFNEYLKVVKKMKIFPSPIKKVINALIDGKDVSSNDDSVKLASNEWALWGTGTTTDPNGAYYYEVDGQCYWHAGWTYNEEEIVEQLLEVYNLN